MGKFVIAMIIVTLILAGAFVTLLRTWRQPMGSPEALERARQRNREIEERERRESGAD
jgi:hypothetical protein